MANRRGKVEVVTDFHFLGSKITVDGDCRHEIRLLLLGRKVKTNLDIVLKSRDITLLRKVHVVFTVVAYGCESWTVRKAEHQRTDAFQLVQEKTPESPLDSREIKPVNLKRDQP